MPVITGMTISRASVNILMAADQPEAAFTDDCFGLGLEQILILGLQDA